MFSIVNGVAVRNINIPLGGVGGEGWVSSSNDAHLEGTNHLGNMT